MRRLAGVTVGFAFALALAPVRAAPLVEANRAARSQPELDRAALEREAKGLAARHAPLFVQQTSLEHPERDRPLPVDFDGDWDATNNWSRLTPAFATRPPVVYSSAILSETHAFLTYVLYYPRDWTPFPCVSFVCHDNDLETVLVVVERAKAPGGAERLVFVEAKFHRRYVAARADDVLRGSEGEPVFAVESGGHGITPLARGESSQEEGTRRFTAASRPRSERFDERYELVSLHDTLWARRAPDAKRSTLWTEGERGFLRYTGARLGSLGGPLGAAMAGREFAGGVTPPWGLAADGPRGDWFLDPAFVAGERHGAWFDPLAAGFRYAFNPFLEDLERECSGSSCARPTRKAVQASGSGLPLALLLALPFFLWPRLRARSRRAVAPSPAR